MTAAKEQLLLGQHNGCQRAKKVKATTPQEQICLQDKLTTG